MTVRMIHAISHSDRWQHCKISPKTFYLLKWKMTAMEPPNSNKEKRRTTDTLSPFRTKNKHTKIITSVNTYLPCYIMGKLIEINATRSCTSKFALLIRRLKFRNCLRTSLIFSLRNQNFNWTAGLAIIAGMSLGSMTQT